MFLTSSLLLNNCFVMSTLGSFLLIILISNFVHFSTSANTSSVQHYSSTHHLVEQKEVQFQKWLADYKAPKEKHQEYCHNILKTKSGSSSQFSQDVFIFFNIFKYWPMEKKKGFYIDSGANSAIQISNTYFYDVCLGWDGLCIEPEGGYHQGIIEHRSCVLVKECISDVEKNVTFHHEGVISAIGKDGGDVKCSPLKNMLMRHPVSAKTNRIDFWSLDVEGHELTVLETINFAEIDIKVMLIEDFWISTRRLDRRLSDAGFVKYQQLPIDTVHVQRGFPTSSNTWYYPNYNKDWDDNERHRRASKNKITCD